MLTGRQSERYIILPETVDPRVSTAIILQESLYSIIRSEQHGGAQPFLSPARLPPSVSVLSPSPGQSLDGVRTKVQGEQVGRWTACITCIARQAEGPKDLQHWC